MKASFSRCGNYRYRLIREWDTTKPQATLVGLNPSTADATVNDPTIRRCIGLCESWGFGGFQIVNLFAFRSPEPSVLKNADNPVGPRNTHYLRDAINESADLILMWGNHGNFMGRDERFVKALRGRSCLCAGHTSTGAPKHFLYLKGGTPLQDFRLTESA